VCLEAIASRGLVFDLVPFYAPTAGSRQPGNRGADSMRGRYPGMKAGGMAAQMREARFSIKGVR